MKHVLIIAYHFPPEPTAGAIRLGYLAKYLPALGWQPFIVTQKKISELSTVVGQGKNQIADLRMLGYRPMRRPIRPRLVQAMVNFAKSFTFFLDPSVLWVPHAISQSGEAARQRRFDAVISSAMPPSTHLVASIVAAKFNLPWVADFRDLWSRNPYVARGRIRRSLESLLERRILSKASCITTVSEALATSLRRMHAQTDVVVVPNAYDPQEWEQYRDLHPRSFTLCYAGDLYDGRRSPSVLFSAITQLRAENHPAGQEVRVDFFGKDEQLVNQMATKHGLSSLVKAHGRVPRATAMRAQREAFALIALLTEDSQTNDELGSKVLEYTGARRYIIALGPQSTALQRYVLENSLGVYASNVAECVEGLKRLYSRFSTMDFEPRQPSDRPEYTALGMAEAFASQLERISESAQSST